MCDTLLNSKYTCM